MTIIRAIVIGLALIATPAMAWTGNEMLRHCETLDQSRPGQAPSPADDAFMQGLCLGTIFGMRFLVNATTNTGYQICVPDGVNNGQQMSVVVRYMRNHPEKLYNDFTYLVMDAFLEAWPCKRQ
jgi:hypothetical protein